jgi:hypothetical protein
VDSYLAPWSVAEAEGRYLARFAELFDAARRLQPVCAVGPG